MTVDIIMNQWNHTHNDIHNIRTCTTTKWYMADIMIDDNGGQGCWWDWHTTLREMVDCMTADDNDDIGQFVCEIVKHHCGKWWNDRDDDIMTMMIMDDLLSRLTHNNEGNGWLDDSWCQWLYYWAVCCLFIVEIDIQHWGKWWNDTEMMLWWKWFGFFIEVDKMRMKTKVWWWRGNMKNNQIDKLHIFDWIVNVHWYNTSIGHGLH